MCGLTALFICFFVCYTYLFCNLEEFIISCNLVKLNDPPNLEGRICNASGKLSDERFEMLSQTYEAEQKELEEEVLRLEKKTEVQETQIQNIETFIQKASQYIGISVLRNLPHMLFMN